MEDLTQNLERVEVQVNGKTFYCAQKATILQWYSINDILDEAGVNLSKEIKTNFLSKETTINITNVLRLLLRNRVLGKFLACLLIPIEENSWKESMLNNAELFNELSDEDVIKVAMVFFAGRGELMSNIADFIQNFILEKVLFKMQSSLSKINETLKEAESTSLSMKEATKVN